MDSFRKSYYDEKTRRMNKNTILTLFCFFIIIVYCIADRIVYFSTKKMDMLKQPTNDYGTESKTE